MANLRILAICGSLRQKSTNKALLQYAMQQAPAGVEIELADLSELPFYNADLAEKPASVTRLVAQAAASDALLLACPEYNYSIAPALKNALDWLSREPNNGVLAGKTAAILGSGGGMGTSRAQYHLRQVCVFLDLHLVNKPEVFCNSFGHSFNEQGELVDERIQGLIRQQLQALAELTGKIRN
ncbi:NAD(P)H-dependent oxidoreductase [Rheinheimera sp.]|uniref:NADPH-dependent FMN reductase n=1 Tax=Rheinheimera sp. TaxID=1869214 RepID=UPI00307D2C9F